MSRFVITGATGGSPNRLEINDFVKNEKFFSLYIQALQAIQKDNQGNVQSFFAVGGIHGLPYVPWDGATGDQPWDPESTWGGYCTHGSVLFPTWHRPYVMLFEQILQSRATQIAATYQVDKEDWAQAAADLRQPYWDWAVNAVPPDEVIALKRVTITLPNGRRGSVDNPLYHYTFHPIDSSFPEPFSNWRTTLRQPTGTRAGATDNVARLKRILQNAQSDLTSSIYNMLTRVHDWPAFSNHSVGDGGSTSNSLEGIHDGIHVYVGGSGHMSSPDVAGFDPIFFLHHTNVDRFISLWAALNPGVWITPNDSEGGSFTIPAATPVDDSTPLTPFWNAQTTFWASAGTQDTSALGYTYPEFNGLDLGNPDAVQTAIANKVNELYGSSFFASSEASFAGESGAQVPQVAVEQVSPPNAGFYDWTARIEFKKNELGRSFTVLLFLGKVPDDPDEWQVSANFVGAFHAFVNSSADRCTNCREQQDIVVEGFVHLNKGILENSGLNSLEPGVVEPYLARNLHWRVQKVDGEIAHLSSLEVSVFATPLSYPPGATFAVPGERERLNGITHGRAGGSRQALGGGSQ